MMRAEHTSYGFRPKVNVGCVVSRICPHHPFINRSDFLRTNTMRKSCIAISN
jgi:hypothetical protein